MADLLDPQQIVRDDFYYFAQAAFINLYPGVPFEENWHIRCISEYLMAMETGDIRRLIILLPPRSLKSFLVARAFPAWVLGRNPHEKFIAASYGYEISEQNSLACRRIMKSDWYKDLFPNVQFSADLDRNTHYETTAGGQYYATSALSPITGLGATYIVCFPYEQLVQTEYGLIAIGDIVKNKLKIKIWSFNKETGKRELKQIDGWKLNGASRIVRIKLSDGNELRCTPNHRIWTSNRGFVEAINLKISDMLPSSSVFNRIYGSLIDSVFFCKRFVSFGRIKNFNYLLFGKFAECYKRPSFSIRFISNAISYFSPCKPAPYLINSCRFDTISFCKNFGFFSAAGDSNSYFFSKDSSGSIFHNGKGSMNFGIFNILRSSSVSKVFNFIISPASIKMPSIVPLRSFSDKSKQHKMMDAGKKCFSILSQTNAKISMSIGLWFKYSFFMPMPNKSIPTFSSFATHLSNFRNAINTFVSGYRKPLCIINDGHVNETFCLTIRDNHTFYCGRGQGIIVANCDDMLKPMEAMSDTIRNSTNQNIRTTFFSRFDDQRLGKLVMIAQRLHEDDPPGNLMRDGGYTVLKLPAETKEKIIIDLKTPTRNYSHIMEESSLLFPARLTRPILDRMRLDMTEIQYSSQMLQSPVPLGGGEFKEEFIQYYYPESLKLAEMNIVILVDPSGGEDLNKKKKKLSDYTAMMVVGLAADNNYYLLDVIRDRLNPTERIETLFTLHKKYNQLSGKSPKVGYEKFSMQSDLHYIEVKKKEESYNFPVVQLGNNKIIKEERIRQLIPDMQKGRWWFPRSLMYVDNEGRRFDLVQELIKSEFLTFPKSRFDDMCFVDGTMIATNRGLIPIEQIKVGDKVLTPNGFSNVYKSEYTGIKPIINSIGLKGTLNHPIFTIDSGYLRLDTISSVNKTIKLSLCGFLKIAFLQALSSMESPTNGWGEVVNIIYHGNRIIKKGKILKACMWQFGNFIMEKKYQKAMKLITLIGIHLISSLKIWSAYRKLYIENCLKTWIYQKCKSIWSKLDRLLKNGIVQRKGGNGIGSMQKHLLCLQGRLESIFVFFVASPFFQNIINHWFVPTVVIQSWNGNVSTQIPGKGMENVYNVKMTTKQKTLEKDFAAQDVSRPLKQRVYNLSVEGDRVYFANGILVHNCDALSYIYEPELFMTFPMMKQSLKQKMYNDIMNSQEETYSWLDY